MGRYRTILLVVLLGLAAEAAAAPTQSRGAYLAHMGDCTSCHTAPGGKPYGGGQPIYSPVGTIYGTNISPDNAYGIGDYTLEDFSHALRKGVAKDGHHLYPAMPFPSFAGTSDADIAALYDYFMHEVAPVHAAPQRTRLAFPYNQRWGMWFWDLAFYDSTPLRLDATRDAEWNRGATIVQGLGHCGACHTPHGPAYEERGHYDSRRYLTGSTLENWHAPSLRGDTTTGLGSWSEDDIAQFLKTGHGGGTSAYGKMSEAVSNSLQYLNDSDRHATAHYLKSLSATGDDAVALLNAPPTADFEAPGAGLYAAACASCHQAGGTGKLPGIPKLAKNPAVVSRDATSVIHIILAGERGTVTRTGPPPQAMPAFGDRFTDEEIAQVATYIRNHWGNNAPGVNTRQVTRLRTSVKAQRED